MYEHGTSGADRKAGSVDGGWSSIIQLKTSELEFPYNTSENSHPRAEGIETTLGKKEGIGNKPP